MKIYKGLKSISVFFACLTLLCVAVLIGSKMINLEVVKTWAVYSKLEGKVHMTLDEFSNYVTIAMAVSYIITFMLWSATFKVGAKSLDRRATRQHAREASTSVHVNDTKKLKELERSAKKAEAKKRRAEKKEAKATEEKTTNTEVKVEVTQTAPTAQQTKYDDILNSLR